MYSIEFNEMVYWFQSEDQFKKALYLISLSSFDSKGNNLLKYSDLAFNNATREIIKCRYDLKEIISSWMYRRSHEDNMNKVMEKNDE